MRYLVDSNWLIYFLGGDPAAVALVASLSDDGVAISTISYMEVSEGLLRADDPRVAQGIFDRLCERIVVLPFERAEATRCAAIRDELRRQGKRVSSRALDLMIACTAIEHGLQLVTRNVSDYADVPGLSLA